MANGKNEYLLKQKAIQGKCFEYGVDLAAQRTFDMICLVLNDKEIMGKNVFGAKRLRMLSQKIHEKEKYFEEAWGHTEETDYKQYEFDAVLRKIFGDGMVPFYERYPYCKEWDYKKPTKKKR